MVNNDPVQQLLINNNLNYTPSGRDYLIKCLNPEHDDSNPSLRVDKISGIAHCFSCGWKRNLFKHYDVIPPVNSIALVKLKDKIKELRMTLFELEFPEGHTPYITKHRGISTATLKTFEAFYTNSIEDLADRIIFPIRDVTGKITSFIARHLLSSANPKYVIYPRHSKLHPYPVILAEKFTSIILVEGIFDMLNMHDKGVTNTVCVFGTQSLENNIKEKLLPYKNQGIHKVFLLFDGDKAGVDAANKLKPLIEAENFIVEIITLPEDEDPGSLDIEIINQIKEYVK